MSNDKENIEQEKVNKQSWLKKLLGLSPTYKFINTKYLKKLIILLFNLLCIYFAIIYLSNQLADYYVNKGDFKKAHNIQYKLLNSTNKFFLNYTVLPLYFQNKMANIDFLCGNINKSLETKNLINYKIQNNNIFFSDFLYYNNTLDIAYINFLIGNYEKSKMLLTENFNSNEIKDYNSYGKAMNLYLLMNYKDIATEYYKKLEKSNPKYNFDKYAKNINLFQYNLIINNINNCENYKSQIENFLSTNPMAITKIRINLNFAEYYAKKNNIIESEECIHRVQKYISEKNSNILNTQIILSIAKIISIYDTNNAISTLEKYNKDTEISNNCTEYYINELLNKNTDENIICTNLIKVGGNY